MATNSVVLKFAKLSENATTPTRGSSQSAGYDLYRYSIINESIDKVSISDGRLCSQDYTYIYSLYMDYIYFMTRLVLKLRRHLYITIIYGYYVRLILHYYNFVRKGGVIPEVTPCFRFIYVFYIII